MDNEKALDVKFKCEDLNKILTVREYLKELLITLWSEEHMFSGKRPFGNSGWRFDVYFALINAGYIPGTIDEEENMVEEVDFELADKFIINLIKEYM